MTKAAKVLYIISIVLCALTVLSLITTLAAWDSYKTTIEELITELIKDESAANQTIAKDMIDLFITVVHTVLIISLFTGLISIGVSIFGFLWIRAEKLNALPHILAIVFGVLGGGLLLIIAGILALVGNNKTKTECANNDPAQQTLGSGNY